MRASRRLKAEDDALTVSRSFAREDGSVGQARRYVHGALLDWKLPDLADRAELVVSELATNSVRHARCDTYRVTLCRLSDHRVRVAVVDLSRCEPRMAQADHDMEHGRGLALVDAMSDEWGTDLLPWGKRVWADLEVPSLEDLLDPTISGNATRRAQAAHLLVVVAVAALLLAAVAADHC
ncbi:ATP-binding protein [Streptomyces flavalbus]|uniref:ATP-binding protein n=1 Tax=Streptomyces flavalbus TaxID=2665155 RepID=A0ABW2W7U8_9ACTN